MEMMIAEVLVATPKKKGGRWAEFYTGYQVGTEVSENTTGCMLVGWFGLEQLKKEIHFIN